MLFTSFNHQQIWFYRQPVDFRKQLNGLVHLVSDTLAMDPGTGQLFIFRNKQCDKLKLLFWEVNGFWLCYRRLEAGQFVLPEIIDEVMPLSASQLQCLLSGLDMQAHASPKPLYLQYYY